MDYTVHGILQARILEWVAFPFFRGSSQPKDRTQIFLIAGGFFTSWTTREAQEYWSAQPIPSPVDLPDPGIELGSPVLQVGFLPAEPPGKPFSTSGKFFFLFSQLVRNSHKFDQDMDKWRGQREKLWIQSINYSGGGIGSLKSWNLRVEKAMKRKYRKDWILNWHCPILFKIN